AEIEIGCTWIMKQVLQQRGVIVNIQSLWEHMCSKGKFKIKFVYTELRKDDTVTSWSILMLNNVVRLTTLLTMWLACHKKPATKDMLFKFGMIDNTFCIFCNKEESINHLFFDCEELKHIWCNVLNWIHLKHTPKKWN
ncbi:unnamed protein product, partial [Vicia faba]